MLYFSKTRILLISLFTLFFVFLTLSNFIKTENNWHDKKINLGLDLQGGSYLLLEIDNKPVIIQTLQNKLSTLRKFFKNEKINFRNLKIENDKTIIFNIESNQIDEVKKMNIPERPSELGGVDNYKELFRLPHMGWNQVDFWPRSKNSDKLCGEFVGAAKHFYFVHSYIFKVEEHKNILATSYYAEKFTCGVNKENIFGTQFHPEKSGDNGLKLIKNFLTL